jgi:hypothetical protein
MPISLPILFEDIKKQRKLKESFDETIAIRGERSAPSFFLQRMKFYTGFVSEDKSGLILRTRYENGVHRVCVPEKKQCIYWRDPNLSGMCSTKISSHPPRRHCRVACMCRQISSENLRNEPSQSNVQVHNTLKAAISADDLRASVQVSELSF